MRITKAQLPVESILNNKNVDYNYVDSYNGLLKVPIATISIDDVGKAFFKSGPKWIDNLFAFRNRLVKSIGLKTSNSQNDKDETSKNFKCTPGEQVGLFKVFDVSANEVILGEDDKHLDFRVSLFFKEQEKETVDLNVSTVVQYHNWLGRFYFIPVKFFHKLIVPTMLKDMIINLQKEHKKTPKE